jgi:hypothetical protein
VLVRCIGKWRNSVGGLLWKQNGDGQLGYNKKLSIYLCEAGSLHSWTSGNVESGFLNPV